MKTTRILAGLLVAIVAAGGGALASHWLRSKTDTQVAQEAPPAISPQDAVKALWVEPVTNADGKPQSLSIYKGHPVVVNFWASWCGPCVEEMPALAELHHEYAGHGVIFVGLGVDSAQNVQTFLKKVPVDYPVFVAGFGAADLARAFGNTAGGLPFTVVIDANGRVRSTKLGQVQPEELRQTLNAL
jgi:thiol-disulfide isomerase/thioredoxin